MWVLCTGGFVSMHVVPRYGKQGADQEPLLKDLEKILKATDVERTYYFVGGSQASQQAWNLFSWAAEKYVMGWKQADEKLGDPRTCVVYCKTCRSSESDDLQVLQYTTHVRGSVSLGRGIAVAEFRFQWYENVDVFVFTPGRVNSPRTIRTLGMAQPSPLATKPRGGNDGRKTRRTTAKKRATTCLRM